MNKQLLQQITHALSSLSNIFAKANLSATVSISFPKDTSLAQLQKEITSDEIIKAEIIDNVPLSVKLSSAHDATIDAASYRAGILAAERACRTAQRSFTTSAAKSAYETETLAWAKETGKAAGARECVKALVALRAFAPENHLIPTIAEAIYNTSPLWQDATGNEFCPSDTTWEELPTDVQELITSLAESALTAYTGAPL